jgi:TetR/AcrR family transcriptional regulator, transcriptional repressor for nem operon
MRYPPEHKETVRATIVKLAAEALRRDGLAGVSIPSLMEAAGLTHGGFYVHFKNRDELVAAAVMAAAEETGANVLSESVGDLDATLTSYLSREHVEHPGVGCVLAALGTEGRRQPTVVRRAFAKAAQGFLRLLEPKVHPKRPKAAISDETLALASQMIGAVVLARLVDDEGLASRLLTAARAPRRVRA